VGRFGVHGAFRSIGRHFIDAPAKRQPETIGPARAWPSARIPLSMLEAFNAGAGMLRVVKVKLDDIYVPAARRKTLHPETVRHLAEDIVENGMKTPIQVRHDGKRYVLVEGLHRMEAAKWLGEDTIEAYLVQARKH
jgi:hypothetical protein